MKLYADGRRMWRPVAMSVALAVSLLGSSLGLRPASAEIALCRSDPAVFFSDGTKLQMSVSLPLATSKIQSITYTIAVPSKLKVSSIVYTGGPITRLEIVKVTPQLSPGYFTSQVLVRSTASAAVTGSMQVVNYTTGLSGMTTGTGTTNRAFTLSLQV